MYIPSTPIVLPEYNSGGAKITLPQDPDPEFDEAHKLIESLDFNVNELTKYGYHFLNRSSCNRGAYVKNGIVIKEMYLWHSAPKIRVPTRIINHFAEDRYIAVQFYCDRVDYKEFDVFYRKYRGDLDNDFQCANVGMFRGQIVFFDW